MALINKQGEILDKPLTLKLNFNRSSAQPKLPTVLTTDEISHLLLNVDARYSVTIQRNGDSVDKWHDTMWRAVSARFVPKAQRFFEMATPFIAAGLVRHFDPSYHELSTS